MDIAIRCPCFHMIYLENDKFATFIKIYDLSFELKLKYFKCSEAVFSEKSHAFFLFGLILYIPSTIFQF